MTDFIAWSDMQTLARYPESEWVYFEDDDGQPLSFENADPFTAARLIGYVETAVGPKGVLGPTYHRLTALGRSALSDREQSNVHPSKSTGYSVT